MIQKLWGVLLILFGFIGSVFYLKRQGKKEERLERNSETLYTIIEEQKNEARHKADSQEELKKRMRDMGYVRSTSK
jgi:hypothetical protein